jgi:predicted aminopeptidase
MMQSTHFLNFSKAPLNNARLLALKTYMMDQADFEFVFQKLNRNFSLFLEKMKLLKNEKKPEVVLKKWALGTSNF